LRVGLAAAALSARRVIRDDVEGAAVELGAAKALDRFFSGVVISELDVGEPFGAAAAVVHDLHGGGFGEGRKGVADLDLRRLSC